MNKTSNEIYRSLNHQYFYFLLFCYFITLPFYMYVYKVNRKRDEESILFPVMNYFYNMVKKSYILIATMFFSILAIYSMDALMFGDTSGDQFVAVPMLMYLFIVCCMLYAKTLVFDILIVILTIERFIVYFFPRFEKTVVSIQKLQTKVIWLVEWLLIIVELSYYAWWLLSDGSNDFSESPLATSLAKTLLYSNMILCISTVLYIPMMINVQKYAHLPSVKENSPQRYMFWQTIVVFFFKSFILISHAYCTLAGFPIMPNMKIDILTTPLIIQISYLLCNKRNVNTLRKNFRIKHFLKVLFGIEENSVVQSNVETNVEKESTQRY